jgi:hypothetical protein
VSESRQNFSEQFFKLVIFSQFCSQFAKKKKNCFFVTNFSHSQFVCLLQLQSGCILPSVKLFVGKSSANKQCMYNGCVQHAKNNFLCFFWRARVCWPLLRPVFLRDVWIRTQRAAVASRRAIPTHFPLIG